jgi:hypothetical protein
MAVPAQLHDAPLGTVVTLGTDELKTALWERDLTVIPVGAAGESVDIAAREVERFLDLMAFLAADISGFLLDDAYREMLTPEERQLKQALEQLALRVPVNGAGPGWGAVRGMLERFGSTSRVAGS